MSQAHPGDVGSLALAARQPDEAALVDERYYAAPPKRRKGRPWLTTEDRLLRELYPAGGVRAVLQALPGRERKAIYSRANMLGLKAPLPRAVRARKYESTDAIDAEIRRVYEARPDASAVNRLARSIMRPIAWIRKRSSTLGLVTPRLKPVDWSREEVAVLEANAHKSLASIRHALAYRGFRRTESAIHVKLHRQGLDRTDPDRWSGGQLARLLGVTAITISRWVREEGLPASRKGTRAAKDAYVIERGQLRRWIADHAQLVDLRKVERYWFIDLAFRGKEPA